MNCILYHNETWFRRLFERIQRHSHDRLQRILDRNAEWCRQAQEAPPLGA
jgi:hypothetical protein